jgi:chromosome segregation ATPase
MVTIEQVRQLESRVSKAIDYVNKVTDENTLLKSKLDNYQKRIDELEVLIQRFKEDQSRIEEGIVSALERLNQFEDDVQKTLTPLEPAAAKAAPPVSSGPAEPKAPEPSSDESIIEDDGEEESEASSSELEIF